MTDRMAVSPPLAGRPLEQDQLGGLLDLAAGGEAQTILVAGSAGVGKTTLVTATTSGRGAVVATGTCLSLVSLRVPFMAVRAAIASVTSAAGHSADAVSVVAGDEAAVPGRFDGWLDRLCAATPVVLVIEDLHWADQFTLDTLMYVIAGPASRRLAVVLTVRRDELGDGHRLQRWLADVCRLPRFTEVTLGPFDRFQTAEQLTGLLGEVPHQALVRDVFRRSGGNPLLTRLLTTGLDPHARLVADTIPSNLRSAVLHSWFRLDQRARELVTILAIGSRPMHPAELAVVAREDAATVGEHLASAVAAGVLEAGRDGAFWFRHPLNAEVLEDAVPADDRRRWHATFAKLLEADLPDEPSASDNVVAEHLFRAGDLAAAYRWALRAAAWHQAKGEQAERLEMLCRAVALRGTVDAAESVDDLLAQVRVAAANAGALEEELQSVDAILARSSPVSPSLHVAELLVRRSHLRILTGQADIDHADLREAVRLSASEPDSREHALALAELAQAELWAGDEDGVERAQRALRIARAANDDHALTFALLANANVAVSDGDAVTGLRFAEEAIEAGLRARDWWGCTLAILWRGNCSDLWSSTTHIDGLSTGRGLLAAAGAPHAYLAYLASAEALSLLIIGDWRECAARLRECLASYPGVMGDVQARLASARLAVWQGRQSEAEQHLARADDVFAHSSGFQAFQFDVVRAEVSLGAHDPGGAYLAALAGLSVEGFPPDMCEWLVPLAARALADQAQAVRDVGGSPTVELSRADELQAAHPAVLRDSGFVDSPSYECACQALDSLYAAELGRARAEPGQGELWGIAADSLESAGLPWEAAYACRRGAEALLGHDRDRARGTALLRRGLNRAQALAAEPLLADLQALALRARVFTRQAVPSTGEVISGVRVTSREREILALLVSGRTYGEIARELVISEKTVSSHISNLLAKTGTSNRVELAGYADRSHLTAG